MFCVAPYGPDCHDGQQADTGVAGRPSALYAAAELTMPGTGLRSGAARGSEQHEPTAPRPGVQLVGGPRDDQHEPGFIGTGDGGRAVDLRGHRRPRLTAAQSDPGVAILRPRRVTCSSASEDRREGSDSTDVVAETGVSDVAA
jgi:hypothetical protein